MEGTSGISGNAYDPDQTMHERHGTMVVLASEHAAGILRELVESACRGEPVMDSTGELRAVLIGEDEYRSLIETLYLLQDPDMASDLERTRRTSTDLMTVWNCPESDIDDSASSDY